MKLNVEPCPGLEPDAIYARLLALGAERGDADARRALSALALVLINHIGDGETVNEAFDLIEKLPFRPEAATSE